MYTFIKQKFVAAGVLCFFIGTLAANATPSTSWPVFINQIKQEAASQGINPNLLNDVFDNLQPNQKILHFDKTQPEHRLTFLQYRGSRVDAYRISLGQKEFTKNQSLLNQIGQSYGVDPCVITALWGMETSYSHYMGTFSVIQSLSTLAYDSPRKDFFRGELFIALHILNDGHISQSKFVGEWAGASGIPQFMPSSWQKYAVDYDGDGRKNIWNDHADAFASVANYLHMNGWQTNQPWGFPVALPNGFPDSLASLKITKTVAEWQQMGVRPIGGNSSSVSPNLQASIITPYGGPAFMVFSNFKTIMKYNNSTFYAASVGYLADQICKR